MSIIIQAGHSLSKSNELMEKMYNRGLNKPQHSYTHKLNHTEVVDAIHKIFNRENVSLGKSKLADNIMVDFLLANLDFEDWGWEAQNNLTALEYWQQLEPDVRFLMVFDHPKHMFKGIDTTNITIEKIDEVVQDWIDYHKSMLDIFNKHPGESILLEGDCAISNLDNLNEQISHITHTLSLTNNSPIAESKLEVIETEPKSEENQKNEEKITEDSQEQEMVVADRNIIFELIIDEIFEQYPEVMQVFNQLLEKAHMKNDHDASPKNSNLTLLIESLTKIESITDMQPVATQAEPVVQIESTEKIESTENSEPTNKIEISVEPNKELMAELEVLKKNHEQLTQSLFHSKEKIQKHKEQRQKKEEENELLLSQLHQAQEEIEEYYLLNQALIDSAKHIREEVETESKKKFDEQMKKFDEEKEKLSDQAKKFGEEKKKLESQTKKLNEEKKKSSDQAKKLTEEKTKLSDQTKKLTEEKTKLSDQAKKLTEEKTKLSDQIKKLTEEKTKLMDERKKFSDQAKRIAEEKVELTNQIKKLTEDRTKFLNQAKKLKEEKIKLIEDHESFTTKYKKLEEINEKLDQDIRKLATENGILVDRSRKLSDDNDKFIQDARNLSEEKINLSYEVKKLTDDNQRLSNEIKALADQTKKSDNAHDKLVSETKSLTDHKEKLVYETERLIVEKDKLLDKITEVSEEKQIIKLELEKEKEKVLYFGNQVEDTKYLLQQEKTQNRQFKEELLDVKNKLEQLETKEKANQRESQVLITQLHEAQEVLEKYYTENQELKKSQQPKKQVYYGAGDRIKKDLPYRLGSKMVQNSKTAGGVATLPFVLAKEYRDFKKDVDLPDIQEYEDLEEAEKVKKHLSYRLGKTLIDSIQSPKNIINLPNKLGKEVVDFKRSNKK